MTRTAPEVEQTRDLAEALGADAWTGLDGTTALAAFERVLLEPGAA